MPAKYLRRDVASASSHSVSARANVASTSGEAQPCVEKRTVPSVVSSSISGVRPARTRGAGGGREPALEVLARLGVRRAAEGAVAGPLPVRRPRRSVSPPRSRCCASELRLLLGDVAESARGASPAMRRCTRWRVGRSIDS